MDLMPVPQKRTYTWYGKQGQNSQLESQSPSVHTYVLCECVVRMHVCVVCVFLSVNMHVCAYLRVSVCVSMSVHAVCVFLSMCMHLCAYVCVCVYKHECAFVCVFLSVCMHMCSYVSVSVCV